MVLIPTQNYYYMKVNIDQQTSKKARIPHNIFMLNIALVHLLMTPAVIALEIGALAMLVPLLISLAIMLHAYLSGTYSQTSTHWFIIAHWKLAIKRYKLLLISYLITAGLIAIGWLLAMASPDPNMREILHTVFIRIAIMPVLIMVMINFYLESSAINMALKGEIPDSLVEAHL